MITTRGEKKPFLDRFLSGVKFCLIFPPYQESEDIVFLKTAKKEFGKIPPLSLCAVAAVLERNGAIVKIVDANASRLSIAQAIKEVANFEPDFLGFTLSTYQFHFTLEWIQGIRSKVNVPVIVGGSHVRIYPGETLHHSCIDYCVIGDAEEALPRLMHSLIEKAPLLNIGGIAYRDSDGEIKVNRFSLYIKDLDIVPFPSRHLIDNPLYYSLISKYKNFTAMTTSRGCVFQCTFCDNHDISYRTMNAKRVVDEMEICKREFNINEIDMFDGLFSVNRQRLSDVCEEIKRRKLRMAWSFRTRADLVDREILKILKSCGCMRIYYGIESGSPKILRNIKKNESLERIKDVVKLTKKEGIDTFGYFMVGNYGENDRTIEESMQLMLSLPFDYVQIAPIFYPPATDVYSGVMKEIGYDYWKRYTINPKHKIEFPIIGTNFNKEQIHSIVRRAYLRFYLRPKFIIKFIFRLKSFGELMRSIKALLDMIKEKLAKDNQERNLSALQ